MTILLVSGAVLFPAALFGLMWIWGYHGPESVDEVERLVRTHASGLEELDGMLRDGHPCTWDHDRSAMSTPALCDEYRRLLGTVGASRGLSPQWDGVVDPWIVVGTGGNYDKGHSVSVTRARDTPAPLVPDAFAYFDRYRRSYSATYPVYSSLGDGWYLVIDT